MPARQRKDGSRTFPDRRGLAAHVRPGFADTARLVCIAHAATACVMALEAWMKTAIHGEKLDMTEPPSEAFDRQEVIVLMGESRDGQKQKFLPIIRHDNGRFFNLGETTIPGMDRMEGHFAQILPPKVADDPRLSFRNPPPSLYPPVRWRTNTKDYQQEKRL